MCGKFDIGVPETTNHFQIVFAQTTRIDKNHISISLFFPIHVCFQFELKLH